MLYQRCCILCSRICLVLRILILNWWSNIGDNMSLNKIKKSKVEHSKIEVIVINRPSKEDSEKKIKELSEYLSLAWVTQKDYSCLAVQT